MDRTVARSVADESRERTLAGPDDNSDICAPGDVPCHCQCVFHVAACTHSVESFFSSDLKLKVHNYRTPSACRGDGMRTRRPVASVLVRSTYGDEVVRSPRVGVLVAPHTRYIQGNSNIKRATARAGSHDRHAVRTWHLRSVPSAQLTCKLIDQRSIMVLGP